MLAIGLFPPGARSLFNPNLRHFTTDNTAVTADTSTLTADLTKAPKADVPQETV